MSHQVHYPVIQQPVSVFFVAQMLFSEDQNFQNCLRIALGSIGKTQESPKETMFLG